MDWREKLFGKFLLKCDRAGESEELARVPTSEALADCVQEDEDEAEGEGALVGIFFSFANISDKSDDFGLRLERVEARVRPRLRVVQVVLWAHSGASAGPSEREAAFRSSVRGKPWLAVPFDDVDTKRRLTRRHRIAVGVPTLVLCGRDVREALLEDALGERFPWRPPALKDLLASVHFQRHRAPSMLLKDVPSTPHGVHFIFYFAAHWCPPCRAFVPTLCRALSSLVRRKSRFSNTKLIIVSSDRSEESYERTIRCVLKGCGCNCDSEAGGVGETPLSDCVMWVPWKFADARAALATCLSVKGIPALVATDAEGRILTSDARRHLATDPDAYNFPWSPRAVSILTERALLRMATHPAVVLFVDDEESEIEFAESVLTPSAESYYEECSIQHPGFCPHSGGSSDDEPIDFECSDKANQRKKNFKHILFYIALDGSESGDLLREHLALEDRSSLLTAVDFPKRRMATMRYGEVITTHSVQNFLDAYNSSNLRFNTIMPYAYTVDET